MCNGRSDSVPSLVTHSGKAVDGILLMIYFLEAPAVGRLLAACLIPHLERTQHLAVDTEAQWHQEK